MQAECKGKLSAKDAQMSLYPGMIETGSTASLKPNQAVDMQQV